MRALPLLGPPRWRVAWLLVALLVALAGPAAAGPMERHALARTPELGEELLRPPPAWMYRPAPAVTPELGEELLAPVPRTPELGEELLAPPPAWMTQPAAPLSPELGDEL